MRVAVLLVAILGSTVGFAACGSNDDRSASVVSSTTTATTVAATTTLPPTTVAPTTTWNRRAKPPLIEGEVDWSAVPIIVTYKPKTPEEQAILVSLNPILQMDFEFANSLGIADSAIEAVTTPEKAASMKERAEAARRDGSFAVPSVRDRFEITGVEISSTDEAVVTTCAFSGGTLYQRLPSGEDKIMDESIQTYFYSYRLRRDGESWRLAGGTWLQSVAGEDRCAG